MTNVYLEHTTAAEREMLDEVFRDAAFSVERRSDREFDLSVSGVYAEGAPMGGMQFSAWLPLAYISNHPAGWSDAVFEMSDYPGMVGDWSAIRDSSEETVWQIFDWLRGRDR